MRVADDPRWLSDPSPSYLQMAEWAGVELWLSSPDERPACIEKQTQLFWPDTPDTGGTE